MASAIGVPAPAAGSSSEKNASAKVRVSPALSMLKGPNGSIAGRKIGVLAADGFADFAAVRDALIGAGARLLKSAGLVPAPRNGAKPAARAGLVLGDDGRLAAFAQEFSAAVGMHRHWDRDPHGISA